MLFCCKDAIVELTLRDNATNESIMNFSPGLVNFGELENCDQQIQLNVTISPTNKKYTKRSDVAYTQNLPCCCVNIGTLNGSLATNSQFTHVGFGAIGTPG